MNGILNDKEIKVLCNPTEYPGAPMLYPFLDHQEGSPSCGLGSFGYDLRLGGKFLEHISYAAGILDPRDVNKELFEEVERDDYFILAPHSQVLAETVETVSMPRDVIAFVLGKSTYARLGLEVNATPLEPMWKGTITLELANQSALPIKLYVGHGIAQAVFFRGDPPLIDYEQKGSGRYQNQVGVTLPR